MAEWLKLSKNVYRKEMLPVGQYRKDADDLDFEISLDTLNHIKGVASEMLGAGIKIPLVKGHDGDSAFGQVLKFDVDEDKETSFIDIEFVDEDCRKEALRNDISAFIPPEFVDGKGNAWKRPLRHVAITPYPVIPGLGQWESIAASFHPNIRRNSMLEDLTKTLALSFEDGTDEKDRKEAIKDAVKTLAGQALRLADQLKTLKAEKTTWVKENPRKRDLINYPDSVVLSFGRSRSREINDLVRKEKITPAVAKELTKKYCSSKSVALALSEGTTDEFEDLLSILAKNAAPTMRGRHSKDDYAIKLSHGSGKESFIVSQAKKLADAAKSR